MEYLICPKCQIKCKGKKGYAVHTRNCNAGKYPPCPECNHFSTKKDSLIQHKQRYCCRNCGKKFFENTKVYKNCVMCGKPLENIRNQQKYCSQKCDSKAYYDAHKEQITEYQKGWKKRNYEKLKQKIHARCRARYLYSKIRTCSVCSTKEKYVSCSLCNSKQNLEKHHPDYSKPDWMVVLCRDCHSEFHARKRMKSTT